MTSLKQPSTPRLPTVKYFFDTESRRAFGRQGKEQLEQFCGLLNSTEQSELRDRFRQLIKAWQKSGPNLLKMMGTDSGLKNLFTVMWVPAFRGGQAHLFVAPDATQLGGLGKMSVDQILSGESAIIDEVPDDIAHKLAAVSYAEAASYPKWVFSPEQVSWVAFGYFTLNAYCEELTGPCARCGNYYVKKRKSQKVYCSRGCGNAATAVVRTAEKVKAERDEKMVRAKALIRKWNTLKDRSRLVWKVWLREHESSITDKFVTRRVNMGELPEPKPGSQR